MKIAVDAMGGDNAPAAVIEGAVAASRETGVEIILVGDEQVVATELEKYDADGLPISIKHASETIAMDDIPSVALRKKKDSSIRVAVEAVKNGDAQAVVSAGNTGAILAISTVVLRPLKGVDRPAIAVLMPTLKGSTVLLDVGANVDCKATQLLQFGIMGAAYARYMLGKDSPSVGLLSIGEEEQKGNETSKEAFKMLKQCSMNFIGNIEGKEVYRGEADVIVCDGFTGNVALKISESLADMFGKTLKDIFSRSLLTRLAYLLTRSHFEQFKRRVDYSEYGGALLLGINGICIIGHGRSTPKAVKNAIYSADTFVKNRVNLHIQEDIEINAEIQNSKDRKGKFWKYLKG